MKKSYPFLLGVASFLFLAVLSGCMSLNIGEKGAVRGRVEGENGPLQGVRVESGDRIVFTNETGAFLLENISSGVQYIFFS